MNVVICVTGAISCLNTPAYLLELRNSRPDVSVTVILSKAATRMIVPSAVGLFADHVIEPSHSNNWRTVNHVELASAADVVAVAPASASRLSRLARGDGDDLIGLVALAHTRPLLVFPAMNQAMWQNAAVTRNRETLVNDGHVIVGYETNCFEVLTGDSETSIAMPPPRDWVAIISEHGAATKNEGGVGLVDAG